MSLPKVSIVGRPNVGKSSIFNWLAGLRLAIVDEVAGVTRDRMQYVLEQGGRYFEIIDTGGIGINDVDQLDDEIEQQIEAGIREADLLMFVVDARDGLTVLDKNIAERLRSIGK
ncbi:MAG: GTPase, partial [Planctomycetota bacterium]